MLFRLLRTLCLLSLVVTTASACAERGTAVVVIPDPIPAGNPAHGRELFVAPAYTLPPGVNGDPAPGCSTCHALEAGQESRGPLLAGVAARAALRVREAGYTGQARTAQQYLWESIISPKAYESKAGPGGWMYESFAKVLSQQDIADLVAFLMTQ